MTPSEFKTVWLPLENNFYRAALYMLEDKADAADAVQDLYIRLWSSLDKLDGILQPKAYGLRMIKNICMDRIRHNQFARLEPIGAAETGSSDTYDTLTARETLNSVDKAIASLPENQRKVLEMRVFEHLEYKDIAAATGLTEGSLRVLLSAARKTLKKQIER